MGLDPTKPNPAAQASKEALEKAGDKVQDFTDKSVTKIEIHKLETKRDCKYEEMGLTQWEFQQAKEEGISREKLTHLVELGVRLSEYLQRPWEKLGVSETRAKVLLKSAIQQAISDGYVTFISGMARGIDLWAAEIVIEERSREEVTHINGKIICAPEVNIINPGFDVTPHELIAGIITEKGILRPDYKDSIKALGI